MFFAGARVTRPQQNQHFPFGGKAHKGCFLGDSHFESTYRSYSIPPLTMGNLTFESKAHPSLSIFIVDRKGISANSSIVV